MFVVRVKTACFVPSDVQLYVLMLLFFFFNDTATTEIYTLSLHDALPIFHPPGRATREEIEGLRVLLVDDTDDVREGVHLIGRVRGARTSGWYGDRTALVERHSSGTRGRDLPTSLRCAVGQRTPNPLSGWDNTQTFSILPIASRRRRYPLGVRDLSLGCSDR